MPTIVSISAKQKTAVNKSGQVDKFKGKKMGPCAYKNFIAAQKARDAKKAPAKKVEEKPSRPKSVMENAMAYAELRAKDPEKFKALKPKPRDIKAPYRVPKAEGTMDLRHVLPKETVKSIENNPRVLTGKTVKMVSDYHLRGLGIDPKAKRLARSIEVDQ